MQGVRGPFYFGVNNCPSQKNAAANYLCPTALRLPLHAYSNSCCWMGDHSEKGVETAWKKNPSRTKQAKEHSFFFTASSMQALHQPCCSHLWLQAPLYTHCLVLSPGTPCSPLFLFPCWISLGGIPACLSPSEGWQPLPVKLASTFLSPAIYFQAGL